MNRVSQELYRKVETAETFLAASIAREASTSVLLWEGFGVTYIYFHLEYVVPPRLITSVFLALDVVAMPHRQVSDFVSIGRPFNDHHTAPSL